MPKDEWGVKRLCPNCSTRFYDLRNDPMTCPSCSAVHTADSLAAGKMRSTVADKPDPKSAAVAAETADADAEAEDDEVVLDDDDDDEEDVDLGDDVLDDDADDDDSVSLDDLTEVATEDDEEG